MLLEQGLSRQGAAAQKAGISVGQYKSGHAYPACTVYGYRHAACRWSESLVILLQQGGQVKDAFGGMLPMFRGLAGAITLPMVGVTSLAVATGALAYALDQGDSTLSAFRKPWFFPVISPD